MSYDATTLDQLRAFVQRGATGRVPYYNRLSSLGDPYGQMALGVVQQSNMAGIVARSYAIAVSQRYCRPIDEAMWLQISTDLMRADFNARGRAESFEPGTPALLWNVIRDYHVSVFATYGLPPETWTAWIPLQIDGPAKDRRLWQRMVTEDFMVVALQTVWLVMGRIAHKQNITRDMSQHVIPSLQAAPPAATSQAPDPKMAACMRQLAPYQLARSDATPSERLAAFYLAILAQDPGLYGRMAVQAPASLWQSLPPLVSPAY